MWKISESCCAIIQILFAISFSTVSLFIFVMITYFVMYNPISVMTVNEIISVEVKRLQ